MPNDNISNTCFRFLKLDKLQAFTLKHEITGANYLQHRDGHYIGFIPLQECQFQDLMAFFVRQHIPVADCDILVSIKQSAHPAPMTVPLTVNKLLKHIDCQISIAIQE